MEKVKIKSNKIKKVFTFENILCLFIIICPILDVSSFIFRNYFNTNFSISTFIRPIIPISAMLYIFFKEKLKPQILIVSFIYMIYAIGHLYVFYRIKTTCAYGNELRELQYLINYTYMVMNLFIYLYFFAAQNRIKEVKDTEKGQAIYKLKKSVLISLTTYIGLMYLALLTKTSSYTYTEEKIGYKGWFESGNSLGTIMLLSLFIVIPMMSKKYKAGIRIWALMVTILVGAYVTTLLGTRVGLLGYVIVVIAYALFSVFYSFIHSKNINKKAITLAIGIIGITAIILAIFGSKTLERRQQLRNKEDEIYDTMTETTSHVTGDITELVKKIKQGQLDPSYMSLDMQKAMLELYETANEKNISNTNMRALQFIYHSHLIKIQNNIPILLLGNGYMTHFYEMIFEMEVPAFLYNFGVVGFFIYLMPFLIIMLYGAYIVLRKLKKGNAELAMLVAGAFFAIVISFVSGYTFFNSSTMMIIIVLCTMIINDVKDIEDSEMKIYKTKDTAINKEN